MDMCNRSKKISLKDRAAFTLVEILVAVTILLIIVVIFSMIFQQTSGAYQTGLERVKATMELRSVMGAIERDLMLAVSAENYPGITGESFSGNRLAFLALTGKPNSGGRRTPEWIEIKKSGNKITRTCEEVVWSGTQWRKSTEASAKKESNLNSELDIALTFSEKPDPAGGNFPLRVEIKCSAENKGKISSLSARSSGRNRKFDSGGKSDDIIVGVEEAEQ